MYLSRVQIDTNNRQKIRSLTHLGAYHDWVERSFPQEWERGERSRKLWRIDRLGGRQYLLVVSNEAPELDALCRYGVQGTAEMKLYDPFLNALHAGEHCRFRVVLNPVVAVPAGHGERGHIRPHVTVEHQMAYLSARAEKHGFSVQEGAYSIIARDFAFWRKGKEHVRLSRVAYEGILKIEDASLFRTLLTEGMGKKKAYGFGMMTVIPLEA